MVTVVFIPAAELAGVRETLIDVSVDAFRGTEMEMDERGAADLVDRMFSIGVNVLVAREGDLTIGYSAGVVFSDVILGTPHFAPFRQFGAAAGDYYYAVTAVRKENRNTKVTDGASVLTARLLVDHHFAFAGSRIYWARTWPKNRPVLLTLPRIGFIRQDLEIGDRVYFKRAAR